MPGDIEYSYLFRSRLDAVGLLVSCRVSTQASGLVHAPARHGLKGTVFDMTMQIQTFLHLPAQTPSPLPNPPRLRPPLPSLTGLFATRPCALTPSTTLSSCVSTTTPPTIISPRVACSVSKLKIRSSSHTFSKRPSRAWTKTCIRSSSASGDSVDVDIIIK